MYILSYYCHCASVQNATFTDENKMHKQLMMLYTLCMINMDMCAVTEGKYSQMYCFTIVREITNKEHGE